jgi:hypothetical protein
MDAAEGSSSKGYRRELKLHERERKAVMVSAERASSSGRSPPCRRPSSGRTPPRARPRTKNPNHIIRAVAFVARRSSAATFAYLLVIWVGLPNSLWAAISALVVSQEQLSETRSSLAARILGNPHRNLRCRRRQRGRVLLCRGDFNANCHWRGDMQPRRARASDAPGLHVDLPHRSLDGALRADRDGSSSSRERSYPGRPPWRCVSLRR